MSHRVTSATRRTCQTLIHIIHLSHRTHKFSIHSLLVDFAAFPAKLVEMIQGCCCCCPPASVSDAAAAPPAQFSARCVAHTHEGIVVAPLSATS